MINSNEENPKVIQDFFEEHYWPALDRLYNALKQYEKDLPTNNGNETLPDWHPSRIELVEAHAEWSKMLHELNMVKKLIDD